MKRRTPSPSEITRRDCVTVAAGTSAGVLIGSAPLAASANSPAPAGAPGSQLIEDLVAANRSLAEQGILDGYGHVSARHDRDPSRYLLARDLAPALVTADDILEYDLDSNSIDAKGHSQYLERFIHGEIYKLRPEVNAVVHSHSPAVVPFTVSDVPLRPVFHTAAFIVEGVPIFDAARDIGIHHLLIMNAQLGHALAQALGSKPAVLIRGHGTAVVGTSLPMAVGRSVYLDISARIQAQAVAIGGNITYLDTQSANELVASTYQRPWELWKRRAVGK